MAERFISYISAVGALFIMVTALNPNKVLAAGDCIEQPNSQLGPGEHWYYHFDPANSRVCWHLVGPGTTMIQAEGPKMRPSSDTTIPQPHQSSTGPRLEQADERLAPPLDQANRDALSPFEE